MTTIIWLEHMYQPAWNFTAHGTWNPQRMINECYRPNAHLMKRLGVKIAMNITQTMREFFTQNNALDVLDIYTSLGAQIEYVGSTAHHILCTEEYTPVLAQELRDQHAFIAHQFGQSPRIFFPPELAIDHTTARAAAAGYRGIIVSGGSPNFATNETSGIFSHHGLKIFAHNPSLSAQFSFPAAPFTSDNDLEPIMHALDQYQLPVLLAFDHETFGGYHNPHAIAMKQRFFELAIARGWTFAHPNELLDTPAFGTVDLAPTTWAGSYAKWNTMPEREHAIRNALATLNDGNEHFLRKYVLPSCHLHADYATDKFWEYLSKMPAPTNIFTPNPAH